MMIKLDIFEVTKMTEQSGSSGATAILIVLGLFFMSQAVWWGAVLLLIGIFSANDSGSSFRR